MFWLVDIKISAFNNHRKTKKCSKLIGGGVVSGGIFFATFLNDSGRRCIESAIMAPGARFSKGPESPGGKFSGP